MQTTKEILTKARSILAKRGWTKGALRNSTGQVCALGALYEAYDGVEYNKIKGGYVNPATGRLISYHYEGSVKEAVDTIQGLLNQDKHQEIPDFNDDPETKVEDVYAIFDNAILRVS